MTLNLNMSSSLANIEAEAISRAWPEYASGGSPTVLVVALVLEMCSLNLTPKGHVILWVIIWLLEVFLTKVTC